MEDNTQKSIWNFDGAQLYNLFQIKTKFLEYLLEWDLENCYWMLRFMRMELDSKLSRGSRIKLERDESKPEAKTEKIYVDELQNDVDSVRNEYLNYKSPTQIQTTEFFLKLESYYMELCYLMKKHGLYFREGDDNTFAVLKR